MSPRSLPAAGQPRAAAADPGGVRMLAELASRAGTLAIDTEFVGEGRYRTLLCVVAVAVPDGPETRVAVLDALDAELDPAPLAEVLADPDIELVLHAGRQDVALLKRVWRTEVRSIFDTQLAAAFAGLRAQASYESVLRAMLGVRLAKTASYTRWDKRPLTPEQLSYAGEDVVHLVSLADALRRRLEDRGRLEWAREECRFLEGVSDERTPEELFGRLPRVSSLDPRTRAVAAELVQWREEAARGADRPASSVLNDSALVELSRRRPGSREALNAMRGVPAATAHRRTAELLAAIARGQERPPYPAPEQSRERPAEEDAPLVALAEALVRTRALQEGLAYELLCTRSELQAVVAAVRQGRPEPGARALGGWRRALVGEELLALLAGQRVLGVEPGGGMTITSPAD